MSEDIITKILDRNNLNEAFKRVKANKGASGIDDMDIEKIEVLYTFLVYGRKLQTPANNTTDDVKYADGTPVLEINKTISE